MLIICYFFCFFSHPARQALQIYELHGWPTWDLLLAHGHLFISLVFFFLPKVSGAASLVGSAADVTFAPDLDESARRTRGHLCQSSADVGASASLIMIMASSVSLLPSKSQLQSVLFRRSTGRLCKAFSFGGREAARRCLKPDESRRAEGPMARKSQRRARRLLLVRATSGRNEIGQIEILSRGK